MSRESAVVPKARGRADVWSRTFPAMGTRIELFLDREAGSGAQEAFAEAEREIMRLEASFSRFRSDSELTELNLCRRIVASEEFLEVVELALAGRQRTGGRFDPTIHDALVRAGYDRSFDLLPHEQASAAEPTVATPCGGRVFVDGTTRTIELEPGTRLDLGGIGKGYAVDRACAILADAGPCLVNAGGDLAVQGAEMSGWPVGIEVPGGDLTLLLRHGGIATSGRDRRRWRVGGEERHHLIDPSTGQPTTTDLVRVTVVGKSAVDAEITAKSLILAGKEAAVREADAMATPCVLVPLDGEAIPAGGLA